MASVLGQHGYATVAFDVIAFVRGMTAGYGFQSYVDNDSLKKAGVLPDAELTDHILSWLAARPHDRPFFLFVRYNGPHWPYNPKREFHDLFGTDDGANHSFNEGSYGVSLETDANGLPRVRLSDPQARRRLVFGVDFPPPVLEHMILHYDASVRTVDEQIGRVVDALRQAGLLDTTLLVVTSDHGDSFGERGYLQHGPRVDEVVMRVPLIVRFPQRAAHGRAGGRVAQLVRTIDILPTVLATLRIPIPGEVQGKSLLPALDDDTNLNLTAYGESAGEFIEIDAETFITGLRGRHRMLRTERWKLVHIPDNKAGIYRLHDMANEGENEDVGRAHPDVLAEMRANLDAIVAADPRSSDASLAPRPLTEAQRERLRALGYL
jgi:arylsulfatase A-like enzyme